MASGNVEPVKTTIKLSSSNKRIKKNKKDSFDISEK